MARTFKPKRRPPTPRASSAFLEKVAQLREAMASADAADDGLACCPACGGTKGVALHNLRRTRAYPSGRHYQARCRPCGQPGPIRYGTAAARSAWNQIDRSHLETTP